MAWVLKIDPKQRRINDCNYLGRCNSCTPGSCLWCDLTHWLTLYISVSVSAAAPAESGTVRSESWSYEEQQVEERSIEEGIRQVEFLLSSVLRERSRNLRSRASEGPPRPPLLSDIERQIRQLELGQHTLAQVIQALRDLARNHYDYEQQPPLEFQARVDEHLGAKATAPMYSASRRRGACSGRPEKGETARAEAAIGT